MTIDYQRLRLDGVYQQDKNGHLMLRVRIPAWVLSVEQAATICRIAEKFGRGILHLTSRGSIEFHWLGHECLEQVFRQLAAVGLTSRGACGGAVRGISCSTGFAPGFVTVQNIARQIHAHFAGNAVFEGLPKKFKVGIETGYQGARHLIQDVGLVLVEDRPGACRFDFWCAGGLGREPQSGFLLERAVPEQRLMPMIEAIVKIYKDNTPPPKRLKFLLNQIGATEFRKLLQDELGRRPSVMAMRIEAPPQPVTYENILTVPVFAGEIKATLLADLASLASKVAGGFIVLTADQNIALPLTADQDPLLVRQLFAKTGIDLDQPQQRVNFRVCPGNHECRMGLAPTREVAGRIIDEINRACGDIAYTATWAISGCRNSCSQPQLADFGIVTSRLVGRDDGVKEPRFDVYRREGEPLGICIAGEVAPEALYQRVRQLL